MRRARLAGLLALAALAAGCKHDPLLTGSLPQDTYRTRHPIIVAETAETMDVPVGRHVRKLSPATLGSIEAFGHEALARRASVLTIMVPAGSGNEHAAYGAAREVAAALRASGVPVHRIAHVAYPVDDPKAEAPIRVSYPRLKAGVPNQCGLWPDNIAGSPANRDYWEFGCATQTNLATMVADPNDFVTPRGQDPVDPTRRTVVLDKYRKGEKTKTEYELKDEKVSDVGGGEQ